MKENIRIGMLLVVVVLMGLLLFEVNGLRREMVVMRENVIKVDVTHHQSPF